MNKTLWSIGLLVLGQLAAAPVQAQASAGRWPEKAVRLVVPFAAGSFTDTAARVVGAELSAQLGHPFIIENRGGAGSTLGTDVVAKAAPDGYTFLLTDNSFAVSSALYDKLPYKPASDIVPVSLVADGPAVLVGRPGLPTKTLKATIEAARKNPVQLTFGSGGQGSSAHLAMEAFLMQNKLQMVHVPFRGISAAILEVSADRVDLAIGSVGSTSGSIKDGRLIGLAVSGTARNPAFPNVPTFAEAGFPSYKMVYWFGVMAPAGTPSPIVDRLQHEIAKAVASPKVREVFGAAGVRPVSSTPAAFQTLVHDETGLWADVIKRAHITPQ
jgi:tripartite-type tricarboxylate transporter receptor subunit TctC